MTPRTSNGMLAGLGIALVLLGLVGGGVRAQGNFSGSNADWEPVIQEFDGVEMVLVPAGCFQMGSINTEPDQRPVHEVCFEEPFWLDRYEVSNGQFARFGGLAAEESYNSEANYTREQITWYEAQAYCKQRGGRLPTEAEWEYAARGPDELLYPWGNTYACSQVNADDETEITVEVVENEVGCDGFDQTAPVGSFPAGASWVGALDMSGNVWEWVADRKAPYPSDAQTDPVGPLYGKSRVLRGGSWHNAFTFFLQTTFRGLDTPSDRHFSYGFRCVQANKTPEVGVPLALSYSSSPRK